MTDLLLKITSQVADTFAHAVEPALDGKCSMSRLQKRLLVRCGRTRALECTGGCGYA
jgi:hypothetical protein